MSYLQKIHFVFNVLRFLGLYSDNRLRTAKDFVDHYWGE
jgi:hypothetical protein